MLVRIMSDASPNQEQATCWNEQAGPRWVSMQRDLDAELEVFGVAVADALAPESGSRVLDVGCGAGATTLLLAERVRPGKVLGVDISAPLLERARERAAEVPNASFELGDAQTFAFEAASYDAVFSRFGVMFFADPVAAFANLRRALRKGGKLGFVCWRGAKENPSFTLPLEAAQSFLKEPNAPSIPGAPGPFAFEDAARVRDILTRAGYTDVNVVPFDTKMVFAGRVDIEGAVELALQIGPLSRAVASVPEAARGPIRDAVRAAFLPHHGPTGVLLDAATWIVTART